MPATSDLDRYRHISRLGSGGMSTVLLAEDTLLGRHVALKRMHPMEGTSGGSRLRREALIGASLSHANLVPIYDIVAREDGDEVIVMEYVEGETLRHAIKREGGLGVPRALRILEGVAAALDAIHAQGIVHRDVKPANILLGSDGSVKLADLGVASAPDQTAITTEGDVVGTFSYMAPEQLGGERATHAADIYALAAVAFEALSGRKARTEPNPLALAHAIASSSPPDLREAWPAAPAAAADLLVRGMSRRPQERPGSAGELTARLRQSLAPDATAALAPPRKAATAAPAPAPEKKPEARKAPPVAPPPERPAPKAERERPAPKAERPPPADARRRRLILAAALIPLLIVAGAIAAIAASGGSGHHPAGAGASTPARTPTNAKSSPGTSSAAKSSTASSTGAGSSGSTAAPAGTAAAAGSPAAAVERFYTLAAGHDYNSAWALADPSFQQQLGGYQGFQSTMSATRAITFNSARTVSQSGSSATVAVQTTSERSTGTQHCAGPVQLVRGSSGGWLLHQIGINCS